METSKSLNDQGAYAQVNGLRIYYETYGEGIPVILLHGGLETCGNEISPLVTAVSEFSTATPIAAASGT